MKFLFKMPMHIFYEHIYVLWSYFSKMSHTIHALSRGEHILVWTYISVQLNVNMFGTSQHAGFDPNWCRAATGNSGFTDQICICWNCFLAHISDSCILCQITGSQTVMTEDSRTIEFILFCSILATDLCSNALWFYNKMEIGYRVFFRMAPTLKFPARASQFASFWSIY